MNFRIQTYCFTLLLFFSCIEDKGILRELPQVSKVEIDYDESKALNIYIDSNNAVFVNKEPVDLIVLKEKTSNYVEASKSKTIIVIKAERETMYSKYIDVQNTIVEAINSLRRELAKEKFNKDYDNLNEKELLEIKKIYPLNLIE